LIERFTVIAKMEISQKKPIKDNKYRAKQNCPTSRLESGQNRNLDGYIPPDNECIIAKLCTTAFLHKLCCTNKSGPNTLNVMSELAKASVSAVKWSTVTTLGRFAMQLIAQVVLARLLGPENYGIFGIGLVVYTFSTFLANFGFGWSLQQRATVDDADIRFAFTWQVIIGAIATVALYLAAPTCADYFHEPRSQSVIEWLSLGCLISAAASPAGSLLQRDLNFRKVGLIQVGSYAIGYLAIGIPLALQGFGANALLAAWMSQMTLASLGVFLSRPHSLKPLFWYAGARSAMGTGSTVFVTNIVNWFLNNLDRILIGRLLNTQSVGLYTAGYNLATMPNALLLSALQPTFLAAGARLQSDHARLGQAYLSILSSIAVLVLPFFAFLSSIAPDLIHLLYGDQWRETGWVLSILFIAMPAYVAWGMSTPVLWNTGRKHYESLLQLPILVLGAIAFYLFAADGLRQAASIAAAILVLRATVIMYFALRAVACNYRMLLPALARGLTLALLAAASALAAKTLVAEWNSPFLALATSSIATLLAMIGVVLIKPGILGEHAKSMLLRFAPQLTRVLAK